MNKKLKFKGSMKRFMRWPLYLTILLVLLNVLIFTVNVKAGLLSLAGLVIYVAAALLLTHYHRPMILNDLIAFANQYESLEKRLLDDLALPYAIMDTNGRMIWSNKVFSQLTGKDQMYNKNINTIFPEITPERIPIPEKQAIAEMSTSYGDRIYRVSMQLVTMKDVINEARILENVDSDVSVVAMFFYDETELQEYIQKNEDDKLVVALAYLDNYEEALEGVEDVRRSLLIALIDRKITKYFSNFDGLVRKLERDKYFLIMRQSSLEALKEQRFHILDEVKTVNIGNEMAVTLSIGIGLNGANYLQNYEYCRIAIEMAPWPRRRPGSDQERGFHHLFWGQIPAGREEHPCEGKGEGTGSERVHEHQGPGCGYGTQDHRCGCFRRCHRYLPCRQDPWKAGSHCGQ